MIAQLLKAVPFLWSVFETLRGPSRRTTIDDPSEEELLKREEEGHIQSFAFVIRQAAHRWLTFEDALSIHP
jgi:hypothetical protein